MKWVKCNGGERKEWLIYKGRILFWVLVVLLLLLLIVSFASFSSGGFEK